MLKHATFLGVAAVGALLSTTAVAQEETADTVVATVGETEITLGEVIIARAQLPAQFAQFPNDVLFNGILDQLIQQQLLADQIAELPASVKYTLSVERRSLLAAEMVDLVTAEEITDADIEAAYEARFADVPEIEEFNASHLLVDTEEEAIAAKARIDDGQPFADVARDVSTGPTGPNGGNLGWFGSGAMVPEFEAAVMALEIGGVSEPFETQFGWHVTTLNDKRVQPRPPLEQLRRELLGQLQEEAINARLEVLIAEEDIVKPEPDQFDPSLIDRVDLLE